MHKITKGLKKKKKTKKSKKGEDDLFKPEELEKYRKEHEQQLQQAAEGGEPQPQNEEWKKFLALTSGVDDILKKTQGDLDRIRSTSFFQRKPTEVEIQQAQQEQLRQQQIALQAAQKEATVVKDTTEEVNRSELGIVEVSESESEEEEDDGIFDTAYIDAVEAGELKLANIPESPTDLGPSGVNGDDPFDTSIADRAILGPQVSSKGRRLVPLGAAVEVLTGRVELPTCATKRPISQKRQVFKERDLLLGSFDQDTAATSVEGVSVEEPKKTVLDEDIDLPDVPIDLSKPIQPPAQLVVKEVPKEPIDDRKDILEEFDVIAKKEEDDDDKEFELLAVESVKKPDNVVKSIPPVINNLPVGEVLPDDAKWNAFDAEPVNEEVDADIDIDDPFDTTFAAKVVPFEENQPVEVDLFTSDDRIQESELNFIKPEDRDLLGGSHVDLPSAANITHNVEDDDEFDPRAEERQRERSVSRPEVLNIIGSKTVSFDIASPEGIAFDSKVIKPLTPFYVPRKEEQQNGLDLEVDDPFDTSRISDVQPGKAELKCIESELLDPEAEKKLSLVDHSFDPRDETRARIDKAIEESSRPRKPSVIESVSSAVDLLAIENDISAKVLTPAESLEELAYSDPFDTSIASNILPGKTELKLLESELIFSEMTSANPFFFNEEPYGTAAAPTTTNSAVSNPFLLDNDGDDAEHGYGNTFGTANDNPFLSQTAATISTNPFSFDPMELEPAEGEIAQMPHLQEQSVTNDFFSNAGADKNSSNVPVSSFFDSSDVQQLSQPQQLEQHPVPTIDLLADAKNEVMLNSMPQKPVNLDLSNSSQSNGLPPRPAAPPPRPPFSNETRALLAQVTGTMDAASTSLLDKIPPTRTPSPVSMRDLHSPSPTPDVLGVDMQRGVSMEISTGNQQETDLVSFSQDTCDINQNPQQDQSIPGSISVTSSLDTTTTSKPAAKPPRPTPPRPPKPQPPKVKPPLPQEPPKPAVAPVPAPTNDDDFDLFGSSNQRPPKPVTKDDILNLYNTPKQQQQQDLLSDPVEVDGLMTTSPPSPVPPVNASAAPDISTPMSTDSATHAIITNASSTAVSPSQLSHQSDETPLDSVFSPEQLSKGGSVSSATFNPFSGAPTSTPIPAAIGSSQEEKPMDMMEDQIDAAQITPEIQKPPSADHFSLDDAPREEPASRLMAIDQKLPIDQVVQNDTTHSIETGYAGLGAEPPSKADDVFAQTFSQTVGSFEGSTMPPNALQDMFGSMDTSQDAFFQKPDTVSVSGSQDTFAQDSSTYGVSTAKQEPFGSKAPPTKTGSRSEPPPVMPRPDAFGSAAPPVTPRPDPFGSASTDFDDFEKKFDSMNEPKRGAVTTDAWGNDSIITGIEGDQTSGFGQEEGFDAFLALQEPPIVPQSTPNRVSKAPSQESDEGNDFSVFIRPKGNEEYEGGAVPSIAPPPATVISAFSDSARFNPFDNQSEAPEAALPTEESFAIPKVQRTDSQETPPTPLFDEDTSLPLEPFPRIQWAGDGWEMHLRQPNKKKITGQRFWKKIFVRIVNQMDCTLLQLFNQKDDKDPFQELPLQPCYSVSEIGAQQYDQFGKIFTIKLQYIFYKERPGVRPGQMKKAEKITNKLSQFAAYAIQGDYQGVKEFGSDLKKLGLPVEHAPQVSQLLKLGSLNYEDLKQFSFCIEEALFKLPAHRDRALHYKMEEVQITAVDELYVEQDAEGHVDKQIARVRLFLLGFLTGMPDVELGVNDMRRQGKEVVGRHDIIPVVTEEWIRLEDVEFHSCIQQEDYHQTHIIKFKPPDACYIELMRFRVRPPKNRELPLQLKAQICVTGYKVELRADVLVPGFASRKLGQIPCEDVMIRFPIPECWIYLFRVEKHFRYGSVKSAHRRTGKIKGIERILGTMETLQENLIEVTSGQAKYEHQHRAIVWRCPRLPKEGQGAYTTHNMVCKIALTSYDQMPEKLAEYCYVEFTMPATQVSHTTVRSVSLQNSDSDEPPEKYVRYLARHEYRVGIEHTEGENPNPYAAATYVSKPAATPEPPAPTPATVPEESSSDSD